MKAATHAEQNSSAHFPLRAARVAWISADFEHASGWQQALQEAGLDGTLPVMWQAEGLLNYLTPEAVRTLLAEASKVGKPCWIAAAHRITTKRHACGTARNFKQTQP